MTTTTTNQPPSKSTRKKTRCAERSLKWIGKAMNVLDTTSIGRRCGKGMFGYVLADYLHRYMLKLHHLEEGRGFTTDVWGKVRRANRLKRDLTLKPEEILYLNTFKVLWDLHFKEPVRGVLSEFVDND